MQNGGGGGYRVFIFSRSSLIYSHRAFRVIPSSYFTLFDSNS
jgi:hypothetical protein